RVPLEVHRRSGSPANALHWNRRERNRRGSVTPAILPISEDASSVIFKLSGAASTTPDLRNTFGLFAVHQPSLFVGFHALHFAAAKHLTHTAVRTADHLGSFGDVQEI